MKVGDEYILYIRDADRGCEDSLLMHKHYHCKVLGMYEHHVYLQLRIFGDEVSGFKEPIPFNACLSYYDFNRYVIWE